MMQKHVGRIKLKGIHNDFLTREILDYKLLFKLGSKEISISEGKIRCNNQLYTRFKFDNEIREMGGETFIFPLKELNSFNSEPLFLRLFDKNNDGFLFEIMFNPYVLSKNKSELKFKFDDEDQRFSYAFDRMESEIFKFKLRNLKISSHNIEENDKFRVFMWLSSDLGKQHLIDYKTKVNVLSSRLIDFNVVNGDDLYLNGEIFNKQNQSVLQFKKKLRAENLDVKNEEFENEKEKYKLHLDYSLRI